VVYKDIFQKIEEIEIMWNKPTASRLAKLPRLYETESVELQDKIVHLYFFIGGCDWYAVEFDGEDLFFGYAILNRDFQNAEWGYFSLAELESIKVRFVEIDCEKEISFRPCKAIEIANIREGMGWTLADVKKADPEPESGQNEGGESPKPGKKGKQPRIPDHYLRNSGFGIFAAKEAALVAGAMA
jgi:hypothetical protein